MPGLKIEAELNPFNVNGSPVGSWGYIEDIGWHVRIRSGVWFHVLLILDFRASGWSNDVTIYNAIDRDLTNVIPRSVTPLPPPPPPLPTTESLEFRLFVLDGAPGGTYTFQIFIDSYSFVYDRPGQQAQVYTRTTSTEMIIEIDGADSVRGIAFNAAGGGRIFIAPMNELGNSNNRPSLGQKWYPTSHPTSRFLVRIVFAINNRVDATLRNIFGTDVFGGVSTELPISSGDGPLRRRDYLVV